MARITLYEVKNSREGLAIQRMFREMLGYSTHFHGTAVTIDEADPSWTKSIPEIILSPEKPWILDAKDYQNYAETYVSDFRNQALDKGPVAFPRHIDIDGQYGLKSDLHAEKMRFFGNKGEPQVKALVENIFPYFAGTLGLTECLPVNVNVVDFQKQISGLKIAYLTSEYGLSKATELVQRDRALDAAMPKSVELVPYFDALITFGNFSAAIPLHDLASALYFRSSGLCHYSDLGMRNNNEVMMISHSPLIANVSAEQVFLEKYLGNKGCNHLLSAAKLAVNTFSGFLFNPRNYVFSGKLDAKLHITAPTDQVFRT